MDFLRRFFAWLFGNNFIMDPERAITDGSSQGGNSESRNSNSSVEPTPPISPVTCDCRPQLEALFELVEIDNDKHTTNIETLLARMDRHDMEMEAMKDGFYELKTKVVGREQESLPEFLVGENTVQQSGNESLAAADDQFHSEQNQSAILNVFEEESITNHLNRPCPQEEPIRMMTPYECYKMNHKNRGVCLIFTHEFFKNTKLTQRCSAPKEANIIKAAYERVGFTVNVYSNYTAKKIEKELIKLGNRDYSDDDCICICISTHGGEDILWALDYAYPINMVEKTLANIKTLVKKPKLMFIQACRGEKIDQGINLNHVDSETEDETDNLVSSEKHPSEADFLIVHSTAYGYVSWRDWFFPTFCNMLNRFSEKDEIGEILNKTARVMCARESRCNNIALTGAKQVPAVHTTLTRQLYLKKK